MQAAVGIEQARPDCANGGVRLQEIQQGPQRAGQQRGVRVQKQEITPLRGRESLVVGPREADVRVVDDQAHPGEALAHQRRAAIVRGVIDDHRLGGVRGEVGQLGGHGLQAARQQIARIPTDDEDGKVHIHLVRICSRAINPPRKSQAKTLPRNPTKPML